MTTDNTNKARKSNNGQLARKRKATPDADDLRQRIAALLDAFEAQITSKDLKVSVADYIRLVQLRREFEDQRPKDIKVIWVDSLNDKSASEK